MADSLNEAVFIAYVVVGSAFSDQISNSAGLFNVERVLSVFLDLPVSFGSRDTQRSAVDNGNVTCVLCHTCRAVDKMDKGVEVSSSHVLRWRIC